MIIDFAGTGAGRPGNLNAPRAVVQAAVLYVLRCLVAERPSRSTAAASRR
jgi:5-oxoprolinase (ATP-hydrolysing)